MAPEVWDSRDCWAGGSQACGTSLIDAVSSQESPSVLLRGLLGALNFWFYEDLVDQRTFSS